jgi:transposase
MQAVTTIGLDIAKSVFQVHGVDAAGQVLIRRQLKRRAVLAFFQKLPVCLVGIEALVALLVARTPSTRPSALIACDYLKSRRSRRLDPQRCAWRGVVAGRLRGFCRGFRSARASVRACRSPRL